MRLVTEGFISLCCAGKFVVRQLYLYQKDFVPKEIIPWTNSRYRSLFAPRKRNAAVTDMTGRIDLFQKQERFC